MRNPAGHLVTHALCQQGWERMTDLQEIRASLPTADQQAIDQVKQLVALLLQRVVAGMPSVPVGPAGFMADAPTCHMPCTTWFPPVLAWLRSGNDLAARHALLCARMEGARMTADDCDEPHPFLGHICHRQPVSHLLTAVGHVRAPRNDQG